MADKLLPPPAAAYTIDYTGCDHMSRDIANIERIAAAGSKEPTPVVYLYEGIPPAQNVALSAAVSDVLAERRRQVEVEDFDASHDDMATKGQLATAAACYAFQAGARGRMFPNDPQPIGIWPWDIAWWKPASDHRRNLVKAGALILAEIDRLDRAAAKEADHG